MTLTKAAIDSIVLNVVLLTLAILAVGLRFTARRKSSTSIGWNDWTILIALTCSAGLCASAVWAACRGIPFDPFTPTTFVEYKKVLFSDIIISHFVYGLFKISVLLFYKSFFLHHEKFNILANVTLVATVSFIIISIFPIIFASPKVSPFWTTSPILDGSQFAINLPAMLISLSVIDISLDLSILLLPIPIILRLHLPLAKKVSVAAIFLLGGFCLVSSVIRLYYLHALFVRTSNGHLPPSKILSEKNDTWAHIEAFASIITACLPTLGPQFRGQPHSESFSGALRSFISSPNLLSFGNNPSGSFSNQRSSTVPKAWDRWYKLPRKGRNSNKMADKSSHDSETGM